MMSKFQQNKDQQFNDMHSIKLDFSPTLWSIHHRKNRIFIKLYYPHKLSRNIIQP